MILSLLLLTTVTLDTLANGMLFGVTALFALGMWILKEIFWLRDDLKKAGKL